VGLTERQQKELVQEAFDPERVKFYCAKHIYFGPVKNRPEVVPGLGCPDCWKIFFIHEMATTPPDKRQEKLDEIEEVLNHMVEMVEKGTWDLKLYPHAKVEIGKE
jgi:hypothetical protein